MAANEENEVYESWEDMEDNGVLDRKIKILQSNKSSTTETTKPSNGGLVVLDDSARQYYGPPDPKVKILKRPTTANEVNQVNGDNRPRQHKTLQQREQEYAEARLRILGAAKSPEEVAAAASNSTPVTSDSASRAQSKVDVLKSQENSTSRGTDSPTAGPSRRSVEAENGGNNIVRAPKGPDGTKGFTRR